MKIDVILITYNQQEFIDRAVQSILQQDIEEGCEVRILVVDDVSTDKTLEIIQSYEKKSPFPFKYLTKEKNVGYVMNYKQAFEACEGDYVAILEGDDYWLKNHIKQHCQFLSTHREYSMSMNNITRLDISTGKMRCNWGEDDKDVECVDIFKQLSQGNQLGNLSACVFRGDFVRQIPESFYFLNMADWELGTFMAQFAPIAILKESTSVYCVSEKGQWAGLSDTERKRSLMRDIQAMDSFFKGKYHKYCRRYYLKIKYPFLRKMVRGIKKHF
ncbi:MAG: glycosyltransferase [Bacteroidaceae bacterium]|nr:glycosyltransferase [Bacteroidaceae bacterium]